MDKKFLERENYHLIFLLKNSHDHPIKMKTLRDHEAFMTKTIRKRFAAYCDANNLFCENPLLDAAWKDLFNVNDGLEVDHSSNTVTSD
jgi:hypothetical protein